MTAPTIRAELARAIRVVNFQYGRLDAERQEQVETVDLAPVELALKSGDEGRALEAVAEWAHAQLAAIGEATR